MSETERNLEQYIARTQHITPDYVIVHGNGVLLIRGFPQKIVRRKFVIHAAMLVRHRQIGEENILIELHVAVSAVSPPDG